MYIILHTGMHVSIIMWMVQTTALQIGVDFSCYDLYFGANLI